MIYKTKRLISILMLMISVLVITGCDDKSPYSSGDYLYNTKLTNKEIENLSTILNSLTTDETDCTEYSLSKYMQPLWDTEVVYNESIYPLENEDGSISPISLLYNAACILSVRDSTLKTQYTKGIDYDLKDGKIIINKNGSIPRVKYKDYWLDYAISGASFPRTGGGHIAYGQGEPFLSKQLAVTYIHLDKWQGENPSGKSSLLPLTLSKLKNKEELNVVFYGDSISEGCNSSGFMKVEPFAEDWCSMVVSALKYKYGYQSISMLNASLGGADSNWGFNNVNNVAIKKPDIVIIGFGMNDGTAKVPPENYARNIKMMIKRIRKSNSNCEFVLVGTMLANEDVAGFPGYQEDYLPELILLEEEGVAVADMTTVHKYLLTKKRFCDMTGNNVNHPNDFLARFYAQVVIKTITE